MHLLVTESEKTAAASIVDGLRNHGHEAVAVHTGNQALEAYQEADLVLLDLELWDMDGLEVCRNIRTASDIPIIAFTRCSTESDKILGLQAGSDDCLSKPYGFRELLARIDAVMRRVNTGNPNSYLVRGPLEIDAATREVRVDNQPVNLTRKEFELLHYLASRPSAVISRQKLMAEIWGDPVADNMGTRVSRTIDTHMSTLRNKLGSNDWIRTVRGVGFQFEAERKKQHAAL
ncbi:DNA-binding response regulator, OmpR family, contains REC and winged-helix (wHTH) domain [Actinopolyspora mzabensis]|uniref:DNA-binding response regulator, OmpR family, contains REC and winged-helix (WHTH) domain n=1 Tax=Actinopolyspora mzabensis TaxID=995066 RepID=A0A1G8ZBI6_ACTMZ|nr:DNA-binding response regulator, OmpR family, contains REC and winged-helix (wHTH) domain [Actinopolyspora mzabensis]